MVKLNQLRLVYCGFLLLVLCNCSIYHSKPATVEEAVKSNNKVKVYTTESSVYKFRELEMKDNTLLGITKKGVKTAKNHPLKNDLVVIKKNLIGIPLQPENIREIHTKNKAMSTIVSVGVPVIISFGALLGVAAATLPPGY